MDIMKQAKARAAQNEQLREEFNKEYRVTYGDPRQRRVMGTPAHKTVFCDHVEVAEGLVRFVGEDGNDRWTVRADRVIEYEEDI